HVTSPLIEQGRLKVFLKFPYGSGCHVCPGYDWNKEDAHTSNLSVSNENHIQLQRNLDTTVYYTDVRWTEAGAFTQKEKHYFELVPSKENGDFDFTVLFSQQQQIENMPDFETTQANSEEHWEKFWTEGAAVDFSGSTDPRAHELERRVVLSQYLTKVNCAGSLPPQETG